MVKKTEAKTKTKSKNPLKFLNLKWLFLGSLISLVSIGLVLSLLIFYLSRRIYPQIFAAEQNLSFLTPQQAKSLLDENFRQKTSIPLKFSYKTSTDSAAQTFEINLKNSIDFNSLSLVEEAFQYGHSKFYYKKITLNPNLSFNQNYDTQIKSIQNSVNQPPLESSIKLTDGAITVTPSQDGLILDEEKLKEALNTYLSKNTPPPTTLPIKSSKPRLSYEEGLQIKKRLDSNTRPRRRD